MYYSLFSCAFECWSGGSFACTNIHSSKVVMYNSWSSPFILSSIRFFFHCCNGFETRLIFIPYISLTISVHTASVVPGAYCFCGTLTVCIKLNLKGTVGVSRKKLLNWIAGWKTVLCGLGWGPPSAWCVQSWYFFFCELCNYEIGLVHVGVFFVVAF